MFATLKQMISGPEEKFHRNTHERFIKVVAHTAGGAAVLFLCIAYIIEMYGGVSRIIEELMK